MGNEAQINVTRYIWPHGAIGLLIVAIAALAAWLCDVGVVAASGYYGKLASFHAECQARGARQVRITPQDHYYHWSTHRSAEGTFATLGDAAMNGYQQCPICRPTYITPLPQPPAGARVISYIVFPLVAAALTCVALQARDKRRATPNAEADNGSGI